MKKFILIIFSILLISLISAIQGGGSSTIESIKCYEYNICEGDYNICNQTDGSCQLNMSSFTGCLVQNCDELCISRGMDSGEYYKDNKCWCEEYGKSDFGTFVKDDGWIEIKECSIGGDSNNSTNDFSILKLVGIGFSIFFIVLIIFVLIAIFIEEFNSSIKFWRLAWRKFRRWLNKK